MDINIEDARKWYDRATFDSDEFDDEQGGTVYTIDVPPRGNAERMLKYIRRPNSKVLCLFHIDKVASYDPKDEVIEEVESNGKTLHLWRNAGHDDGAGAWVAMGLLPQLGITEFDVLITSDEETGNSTAQYWSLELARELTGEPDLSYNWVFQFDKGGSGVATYLYNVSSNQRGDEDKTDEYLAALAEYFKPITSGSRTDICFLEKPLSKSDGIGVKAFNVACAYHNPHSKDAYLVIEHLLYHVEQFALFYKKYKDVKFPHHAKPRPTYTHSYNGRSKYNGYNDYNNYGYDDYDDYHKNVAKRKTKYKSVSLDIDYIPSPFDYSGVSTARSPMRNICQCCNGVIESLELHFEIITTRKTTLCEECAGIFWDMVSFEAKETVK